VVSLRGWEQQAAVFPRNRCSLNSLPGEIAREAMDLARKEVPARLGGNRDRLERNSLTSGAEIGDLTQGQNFPLAG
jgi:hypothetical protein